MQITTSARELVANAERRITTLSPRDVEARLQRPGVLLVDIRDIRERKREGVISGALHAPRGMLEFWVDPDSPYHKSAFADADEIILHCNRGWRSALATAALQDMGVDNIAHMDGGFDRWRDEIGRINES